MLVNVKNRNVIFKKVNTFMYYNYTNKVKIKTSIYVRRFKRK